jgi:DNA-binding NarL/FixJ family response regulator
MSAIRVLIVDDNAVIRRGVAGLLEAGHDIEVAAEAANGRDAVRLAEELRPDVVLLDARMPVMDGLSALPALVNRTRVMMLTYAEEDEMVARAIRAGAAGYLVHGRFDADELAGAVRDVAAGRSVVSPSVTSAVFDALRSGTDVSAPGTPPASEPAGAFSLTKREREVMNLAAQGLARREIADRLVCSEKTVKNHLSRIYGKLGASNRAEAISAWLGLSGARVP